MLSLSYDPLSLRLSVRGPPISTPEPSPRRSTRPEVHRTETCTQERSSEVTPQSRHEIHRTEHWPGYRNTRYRSWGQHTFGPNQGVRYVEEAGNGQRGYRLHSSLARDPKFSS